MCVGDVMKSLVVCCAVMFSCSTYAATVFEDSGLSLESDFNVYTDMNNEKYSEATSVQNQSFLQFDLFGVNSIISNCDANGNCLVQKKEVKEQSDVKSVN